MRPNCPKCESSVDVEVWDNTIRPWTWYCTQCRHRWEAERKPDPDLRDTRMRRFVLQREEDESGVSGVGLVAEGVCFTDGTAALRWRTTFSSTAVYASMDDLLSIHGHGGKTRVVWVDDDGALAPKKDVFNE